MLANMPIIPMTTSSSMSVKPLLRPGTARKRLMGLPIFIHQRQFPSTVNQIWIASIA
jgi:hypothetical protein